MWRDGWWSWWSNSQRKATKNPAHRGLQRFLTPRTMGKPGVKAMNGWNKLMDWVERWNAERSGCCINCYYQNHVPKISYNQHMEIIKRLKSKTYITWKSNVSWALLHSWQTDHDDSDSGRDPWEFLTVRPEGSMWISTTKPNYRISRNVLLETRIS